jgi:hypothetical protein
MRKTSAAATLGRAPSPRLWISLLWIAPWAALGCGSPAPSPGKSVAQETAEVAEVESAPARPTAGADQDLPDAAHEFSLPGGEQDQKIEFLAAAVKKTGSTHKLPFLATCRIEHGGRVTTGAIIHSSPRHGTHILSCRHGRDEGGEWEARLSSGAVLYGKKYVLSKNSDLCLLVAKGQYDLGYVSPVPIRTEVLPAAEPCLSIGYDKPLGDDKFANEPGEKARAWTDNEPGVYRNSADGYPLITTHVPSGPGRSGGGLFVVRTSELIGVCSFRDPNGVHFVGRRSVLAFMNRCGELGHVAWWKTVDPESSPDPETNKAEAPKTPEPKTAETKTAGTKEKTPDE